MKPHYTIIKTLAALVTVLPLTALAAGPTASQGVLLMGFRSTDAGQAGNGTYIVVNIGQAATYRDRTAGTITNINDQLSATFGSNWASRTDIQWGIAGCPSTTASFGGDPANTLYLSRAQTAVGVPTASPTLIPPTQREVIASNIKDALGLSAAGMGFDDSTVSIYPEGAPNPLVGVEDGTLFNNWRVFMGPGGTATKAGTGSSDFGWDTTGIEATPLKTLSLFRFGGAPTGSVTASYLGYFKIESGGTVSFNNAPVSYDSWKSVVGGQDANLDYDGDGIPNGIEWFMGTNGNGFTPNPQIVANTITWPRAVGNAPAASVTVQTSSNLTLWEDTVTGLASGSGPVSYTLPTGRTRIFVRLSVTP